MPAVRFPFRILVPRDPEGSPAHDAGCEAPNHVAVFSAAALAVADMEAADGGEWDVRLVSRPSRPEIEAFLRRFAVARVCVDRHPDGTGGTEMTVEELLAGWTL